MAKRRKSARKSASSQRHAARSKQKPTGAGRTRARIRMYRHGLGDCHLIRLAREGGGDFIIMIDCGVILGTPDAASKMQEVVKDIKKVSGGVIDLLVITHEHWDHLSGFLQAKDEFSGLNIRQVWFAWTEDPDDDLAKKLRREKKQALAVLRLAAQRLALAGGTEDAETLQGILDFFGAAGSGNTTSAALAAVRELSSDIRYCRPADAPIEFKGVPAKIFVLGPPPDEAALKKTLPSKAHPETYGLSQLALDIGPAITEAEPLSPFDTMYAIPDTVASSMEFFQTHYWRDDEWRRIDTAWLSAATDFALQLDSATNNTSLVLAIEFGDGDVLLFAADAQVGNWLSWQDLKWASDKVATTGPDLISRTVFYKVGHHGSHNATLRALGLEKMVKLRTAVIPVDEAMAKKKRWGRMPLPELVTALVSKAGGFVLRSDKEAPAEAAGAVSDPLFFEVTV